MQFSTQEAAAAQLAANGITVIGDTVRHHISNLKRGLVLATDINDAAFDAGDTSVTVTSGAVFPADLTTVKFRYALVPAAAGAFNPEKDAYEIVKITARATNVLTIVRGQFGTRDIDHDDDALVYFYTPFESWTGFINVSASTALDITDGSAVRLGDLPSVTVLSGLGYYPGPVFSKIQLSAGEIWAINGPACR